MCKVLTAPKYPELFFYTYIGIAKRVDVRKTDRINYQDSLERATQVNQTTTFKEFNQVEIYPYSAADLFQKLSSFRGEWLQTTPERREGEGINRRVRHSLIQA